MPLAGHEGPTLRPRRPSSRGARSSPCRACPCRCRARRARTAAAGCRRLEGDQHLVVDLGQPDRAALAARAELHDAGPAAVGVGQPRERHLDPAELLGVLQVGDDRDDHAGERAGPAGARRRGQAVQRALGVVADHERGGVAGSGDELVPCGGQRVPALERLAHSDERDRRTRRAAWGCRGRRPRAPRSRRPGAPAIAFAAASTCACWSNVENGVT